MRLLLCSLAALILTSAEGWAQTVTREITVPVTEETALPATELGAWRIRSQLMWDSSSRRLVRRTFEIWDPLAARGLDVFWISADAPVTSAGRITGHGRLVWRTAGAASYDEHAAVAEYRGDMLDGRAHGYGDYRHRSGASYRGQWRHGLMDGQGRLMLPNGDEYAGGFQAGRRSGFGRYIDRTGTVYEGGFSAGLREGRGFVVPTHGTPFRAMWRGGREMPGSRTLAPEAGRAAAVAASTMDVRIGVVVDRRPLPSFYNVLPLYYTSERSADQVRIFPDDQRLLDVWRGRAEIQATRAEMDASYEEGLLSSFLGPANRYAPTPILIDVENLSATAVDIVGGYIEVASSESDPEPAVHLVNDPPGTGCNEDWTRADFTFENFGWASAERPEVRLEFRDPSGQSVGPAISLRQEELDQEWVAAPGDELRRMGLDTQQILEGLPCDLKSLAECLDADRRAGRFGPYGDAVRLDDIYLLLTTFGTLTYDWKDASGVMRNKISNFKTDVAIGQYTQNFGECGEGATAAMYLAKPFMLKLDAAAYRLPMPIADSVAAGVTARWRLSFDAPESSNHRFELVLELSDGREVKSQTISLNYFKPRQNTSDSDEEERPESDVTTEESDSE